jgi:hypothetical protein
LGSAWSLVSSAAASEWAGWALAHPEFGSSVNPITTRGADYAHHITASPPGFENPAAALVSTHKKLFKKNISSKKDCKTLVESENISLFSKL